MGEREIVWIRSSLDDLKEFPDGVKNDMGFALSQIQFGDVPYNVKPLRHVGNGIMEIKVSDRDSTYRTMYVAKLQKGIYVLHAFKKKSKTGKAIPKSDLSVIKSRYAEALEIDSEGWEK